VAQPFDKFQSGLLTYDKICLLSIN
jgi:hypothetical protein